MNTGMITAVVSTCHEGVPDGPSEMLQRLSGVSFLCSIVIDADSYLTVFPDGLECLFSQFSC